MTDTAYINANAYGDDGEDRRKVAGIDWAAWREQLENWLKRAKDTSGRVYQSTKNRAQNVDIDRVSDRFTQLARGTAANTLAPMFGGMAMMALIKMGVASFAGPVGVITVGVVFGLFSAVRNYSKAKDKFETDCKNAKEAGEEEPSFGFNYLWPVVLKGALTTVFAGLGAMALVDWDVSAALDAMPSDLDSADGEAIATFTSGEIADTGLESTAEDSNVVGAETDISATNDDIGAVQTSSYDVEFGSGFELPENPTAVDRMAAMMPDDASSEVISALEAARDGQVWGVHNLAYHLSFEHGGLELGAEGKQLVLDLYAEAAAEGHQISIDNLATLENMWGMEADGYDAPSFVAGNEIVLDGDGTYTTADLQNREVAYGDAHDYYSDNAGVTQTVDRGDDDALTDNQPSVIDQYVYDLQNDTPSLYGVVEVEELADIEEPVINLADVNDLPDKPQSPALGTVGQPYDLTANLGTGLGDLPEDSVTEPVALGADDGVSYGSVTYGSANLADNDAIDTASNPSADFAASTIVDNPVVMTNQQTVSFYDHEGLVRVASRDGLDLSQDVAFEFIAPNGDSQYTIVTGEQADQILGSDNPGALLQMMVEEQTGKQWAELNVEPEVQYASNGVVGGQSGPVLN